MWQLSDQTFTIHLPVRNPTVGGHLDILTKCTNPEVRLFGPVELKVIMIGAKGSPVGSFEEQIGRTSIKNLAKATDAETVVNRLENACFSRAASQGAAISTYSGPSLPVGPWDQILGIAGVIQATQMTYHHETDTELDVVRNGYFARLIVTGVQDSAVTDRILRAAVDQM